MLKIILLILVFLSSLPLETQAQRENSINFASSSFIYCWEKNDVLITNFASDNKNLLLSLSNGIISQRNIEENSQVWTSLIGDKFESRPYIINGEYFIFSQSDEIEEKSHKLYIRKINQFSGLTIWISEFEIKNDFRILINTENNQLVLALDQTELVSVELNSGKTLWKRKYIGNLKDLYERNYNNFLFLTEENNLLEINYSDGSVIQSRSVLDNDISTISIFNELMIIGDRQGYIYLAQYNNNSLSDPKKLFRTGGKIVTTGTTGNYLYAVSNDNFIYLFSFAQKKIVWKKRLPGRVNIEPIIRDNMFILSTVAAPEIYFIGIEKGNLINKIELKNVTLINDIKQNEKDLFIFTNNGLSKYSEKCQ